MNRIQKSDVLFLLNMNVHIRSFPWPVVVRSYLGYYAGSHQNSAAKRPWARIVLPWVTRWEVLVSYPACLLLLFVKCYFLSSVLSHHTPPFPQTQPQRTVLYPYALCLCFVLMLCSLVPCIASVLVAKLKLVIRQDGGPMRCPICNGEYVVPFCIVLLLTCKPFDITTIRYEEYSTRANEMGMSSYEKCTYGIVTYSRSATRVCALTSLTCEQLTCIYNMANTIF